MLQPNQPPNIIYLHCDMKVDMDKDGFQPKRAPSPAAPAFVVKWHTKDKIRRFFFCSEVRY